MRIKFSLLTTLIILFAFSVWIVSCKKDADPISTDLVASVSAEATMDAQQDEMDDIATGQLSANSSIPGKSQAQGDDRVACAKISVVNGDKQGTITIDFDQTQAGVPNAAGCTDARKNTRSGQLIISWQGDYWYKGGAVISITPQNYIINGVGITGTRTITNISDNSNLEIQIWTIKASHTITWADGLTSTRVVNKTRTWDVLLETLLVTQTPGGDPAASGTTRSGSTYSVDIQTGLLYTLECIQSNKLYIPVSGVKVFTLNGSKSLTFDYGDGTCDNSFVISYNGLSQTITATN